MRWEISGDVPLDAALAVERGVRTTFDYAQSLGYPKTDEEIAIYVQSPREASMGFPGMEDDIVATYSRLTGASIEESIKYWEHNSAASGRGWIQLMPGYPTRADLPPRYELERVAALTFTRAYLLNPPALDGRALPAWFSAGVAEFIYRRAYQPDGPPGGAHGVFDRTYEQARRFAILNADPSATGNTNRATIRLRDIETMPERSSTEWDGLACVYHCGFLAAELLAHRAGGVSELLEFYTLLDERSRFDWRETFRTAFRIRVDDFYDMFENHRRRGFPELNVRD